MKLTKKELDAILDRVDTFDALNHHQQNIFEQISFLDGKIITLSQELEKQHVKLSTISSKMDTFIKGIENVAYKERNAWDAIEKALNGISKQIKGLENNIKV